MMMMEEEGVTGRGEFNGGDGIVEEDGIVEDCDDDGSFVIVDQLQECISETSLKFLSQH